MAYEFKDYYQLRSSALDIEKNMLHDKKKDSVEDLDEPRKSQLQFLTFVVGHLNSDKEMNPAVKTEVLHGAMMLLVYRISNEMGFMQRSSFLLNRLNDALGITAKTQPTHEQYAACFHSLNTFLDIVYVKKDPRQGLITDFTPYKISLANIVDFLKVSQRQEREHLKQEAKDFTVSDQEDSANTAMPSVVFEIPPKLQAQIKSWEKLKVELHSLVQTEIVDKRVGGVTQISNHTRAAQLQFLLEIKDSLDKAQILVAESPDASAGPSSSGKKQKAKNKGKGSDEAKTADATSDKSAAEPVSQKLSPMPDIQKAAILAGAMLIVRGLIDMEYKATSLDQKSENTSKVHIELSKVLGVSNQSTEDMRTVVQFAYGYIRAMTIAYTGPNNCAQIKKQHLFSKIAHFDLRNYLSQIAVILYQCRKSVIKACEPRKADQSKAKHVGWGGMFSTKKGAGADSDTDDSDLDDDDTEKNSAVAKV